MASDIVIRFLANTEQANAGIRRLQSQVQAFTSRVAGMFTAVAGGFGFYRMVQATESFESAMNRVMSILPKYGESMRKNLTQVVYEASEGTKFMAGEAASALYEVLSAGIPVESAEKVLGPVLRYAQAGGMEASVAVRQLANSLSAMGEMSNDASVSMQRFTELADELFTMSIATTTSVQELGDAMAGGAALAGKAMGQTRRDIIITLGVLASLGRQGAEAGTMYRMIASDVREGATKLADEWARLGVAVADSQGNFRPLADIFADLNRAMAGMTEVERAQTLEMLGFEERVKGVVDQLIQMSSAFQSLRQRLEESAGASGKAAETMVTPMESAMKRLNDAFSKFSGVVNGVAEALESVAKALDSLNIGETGQKIIGWAVAFTAAAAAIGFVVKGLTMIAGAVSAVWSALTALWSAISTAVTAVASTIAAVGATVTVLVTVLVAEIALLIYNIGRWIYWKKKLSDEEERSKKIDEGWEDLKARQEKAAQEEAARAKAEAEAIRQQRATETMRAMEMLRNAEIKRRLELQTQAVALASKEKMTLEDYKQACEAIRQAEHEGVITLEQRNALLRQAYVNQSAYLDLVEEINEAQLRLQVLQRGGTEKEAARAVEQARWVARGITPQDFNVLRAIQDKEAVIIAQRRALEEDRERALSIERSLMTDEEKMYEHLVEAVGLWRRGLLSNEALKRLEKNTREKLLGKGETGPVFAPAILPRTQEAYAAFISMKQARLTGGTKTPEERNAKATEDILELLRQMRELIGGVI